jgi:uncharacterized protein (TIGR03663 family)
MSPSKERVLSWPAFTLLAVVALLLGAWYRFPDLDQRPMHLDEAILGVKFIEFWQTGWFDYDPKDYHGPALHWLTRMVGWISGWHDPAALTDADLRWVVALCGMALIFLTLCLTDVLGRHGTVVAMLFAAVSPLMMFYSRYYIMEVVFVVELWVLLVAFWRFHQSRHKRWLWVMGVSLGLLHATKETFVINVAAMLLAWGIVWLTGGSFVRRSGGLRISMGRPRSEAGNPWLWVAVVAVFTSVLIYSSGFRHWDDVKESVLTYGNYLKRSGGVGHEKPFSYYFWLLAWHKNYFVWTEVAVLVLALGGICRAFFGWFQKDTHIQAFLQFLSIYSVVAFICYSVIPYKTPWTILSVHHVFILLAGVGAQGLYGLVGGNKKATFVVTLMLTGALYHLCAQTMFTLNDRGVPNLRAPYLYSHTAPAALQLASRLKELDQTTNHQLTVQVINQDSGWPLGWYLRGMSSRIGYHTTMPADLPQAQAYVVDASLLAELQSKRPGVVFEETRYFLREGVPVHLLVEKTVWETDRALRSQGGTSP